MSAHDYELFAHTAALAPWVAALEMAHSPREPDASRAYDDHGRGVDSFAAGSTTLGPPSAEVKGARGFDAVVASSYHGHSTSLGSSADDDHSASVDIHSHEPVARISAVAPWVAALDMAHSPRATLGLPSDAVDGARGFAADAARSSHAAARGPSRERNPRHAARASQHGSGRECYASYRVPARIGSDSGVSFVADRTLPSEVATLDNANSETSRTCIAAVQRIYRNSNSEGVSHADAARSSHGFSSSLESSTDDDSSASDDSTSLESSADDHRSASDDSTSLESFAGHDCSASNDMPIDAPLPAADYGLGWGDNLPADNVHTASPPHRGHRDAGTRGGAVTEGDDGDNHARSAFNNDLAAAWSSWVTSLPSGTNTPRHLTKRLREARRAFRTAISSAHHVANGFASTALQLHHPALGALREDRSFSSGAID